MKQLFLGGISLCVHLYFFLAFGSLFRKILGRKKGCSWYSPLFTPVLGLFLYYGFFEILALPMTLLLVPLHVLTVVWGAALAAVGLAAVFLCGRDWVKSGNTWYYQRPDGSKLTNSWKRINGSWYYFGADGAMTTGWKYVDGYKFYFGTDGKMVQDVDKLIGKQSSYRITVNRVKCQVTVYAANETGNYCIPVKTFTCSVGKAGTPTHAGTYATLKKQNPVELMGPSWGKYGTQINNYGDWFHSVACSNPDPTYALAAGNYNMLGQPASHGCVRLCVRDAKWIYDNCALGTTVTISDTAAMLFDKPATIKIPAGQDWDPTDPNV